MQDRSELAFFEAARKNAEIWSLDLLKEGFSKGEDRRDWSVKIRDEAGDLLVDLTLAEAAGPLLLTVLS
jgi:hypothetical protein